MFEKDFYWCRRTESNPKCTPCCGRKPSVTTAMQPLIRSDQLTGISPRPDFGGQPEARPAGSKKYRVVSGVLALSWLGLFVAAWAVIIPRSGRILAVGIYAVG